MRRIRTYVEQPLTVGATVELPQAATRHLAKVLRLGVGAEVVLFNGDGDDYVATLTALARTGATAQVESRQDAAPESPLRITLAQALARGEKMDLVLQKATELGVSAIAPVLTERTEVRLEGERGQRRMAHWRGVIASACEQCGRARLPVLDELAELAGFAAGLDAAVTRLALVPDGELTVHDVAADAPLVLVVGPEGGLSERDRAALDAAGFRGLRLGPRILRTETAGLAAIAALQAVSGDLR